MSHSPVVPILFGSQTHADYLEMLGIRSNGLSCNIEYHRSEGHMYCDMLMWRTLIMFQQVAGESQVFLQA